MAQPPTLHTFAEKHPEHDQRILLHPRDGGEPRPRLFYYNWVSGTDACDYDPQHPDGPEDGITMDKYDLCPLVCTPRPDDWDEIVEALSPEVGDRWCPLGDSR